jgi:hypothetical protein
LDFGKFVIDIDEAFVSFVAPKARRHVNGFVRGSDLELLGWVLDGFGRFGCDELWLNVFACCDVFFVWVGFSVGDTFGRWEFIGVEEGGSIFFGIG